jgi:hypothetical protein
MRDSNIANAEKESAQPGSFRTVCKNCAQAIPTENWQLLLAVATFNACQL